MAARTATSPRSRVCGRVLLSHAVVATPLTAVAALTLGLARNVFHYRASANCCGVPPFALPLQAESTCDGLRISLPWLALVAFHVVAQLMRRAYRERVAPVAAVCVAHVWLLATVIVLYASAIGRFLGAF